MCCFGEIILSCKCYCGNIPFLAAKKGTERRRHRGGASKRRPPLCTPPAASPTDARKCPDFRASIEIKFASLLSIRCSKIGTFLNTGRRCARRGFLRGHAFSECPLKSPSFGTFLGDQEKYIRHADKKVYLFVSQREVCVS